MLPRIALILAYILTHSAAWAVGFGNAEVKSYLGEPLQASVPLMLRESERQGKIHLSLASPQDYKYLEQTLPKSYSLLRVDLVKGDTWSAKLSSIQAIDESFMTVIIKVKKGNGNYFKSLKIFLNPKPWAKQSESEKVALKQSHDITPVIPLQATQSLQVSNNIRKNVAPNYVMAEGSWARRDSYGPVRFGDNLSEIAYRLRRDKRYSNRQVMLTLFDANQPAFANGDINHLIKGSYLQVPAAPAVDAFIQSEQYNVLNSKFFSKAKKNSVKEKRKPKPVEIKKEAVPKQRVYGRVSLGIAESLDNQISNQIIIDRLDKLEPLYEQAISTNLRIDGIGGKVDSLAVEVRKLSEKVDALSMTKVQSTESNQVGWIWFFLLFMLNIILLLLYFYRERMNKWQQKRVETQERQTYMSDPLIEVPIDNDFVPTHAEEVLEKEEPLFDSDKDVAEHDVVEAPKEETKQDVADIFADDEVDNKVVTVVDKNPLLCFEESVLKHDWDKCQACYDKLDEKERNLPRTQALYIQKLHHQGELVERNNTLLEKYNSYGKVEWHRFCTYFDEDVWFELQEQKIINFMGNVVEAEVVAMNADLVVNEAEQVDNFDLSDERSMPDIPEPEFVDDEVVPTDKTVMMDAKALEAWGDVEQVEEESMDIALDAEFDKATMFKVEESSDMQLSDSDVVAQDVGSEPVDMQLQEPVQGPGTLEVVFDDSFEEVEDGETFTDGIEMNTDVAPGSQQTEAEKQPDSASTMEVVFNDSFEEVEGDIELGDSVEYTQIDISESLGLEQDAPRRGVPTDDTVLRDSDAHKKAIEALKRKL